MILYTVKDGDVLDWICWRHYGREGMAPAVLEANPGLEHQGPRLAVGTEVRLPALAAPAAAPRLRLWD